MAVIEITQAEYNKKFGDGSNKGSEPTEITQADYDAKFGKEDGGGKIWDKDVSPSRNNSTNTADYLGEYEEAGLEKPFLTLRQVIGSDKRDTDTARRNIADIKLNQELQDGPMEEASDILFGGAGGAVTGIGAKRVVGNLIRKGNGNRALAGLDDIKKNVDRALRTDEADDVIRTSFPRVNLTRNGGTPNYRADIELYPRVNGLDDISSDALPATSRVFKKAQSSTDKIEGVPAVKAVERLLGTRIPVVSAVSDFIGKYLNVASGAVSKNAALKVREQFVREGMDRGFSRADSLKMYSEYIEKKVLRKSVDAGDAAAATGGAVLGAGSQKDNDNRTDLRKSVDKKKRSNIDLLLKR